MECNIAIRLVGVNLFLVYSIFVVYGNHENILTTKISGNQAAVNSRNKPNVYVVGAPLRT